MLSPTSLTKFEDRDQAYFAYWEDTVANKEPAMSLQRFDEFWRGLKGLPRPTATDRQAELVQKGVVPPDFFKASTHKEDTEMATATKTRGTTRLKSAFLINDPDEAYAAYRDMPGLQREGVKVMTKAQFKKVYPERHAAALKRERDKKRAAKAGQAAPPTRAEIASPEIDFTSFDPQVLDALRAAGIDVPEPEVEDEPEEEEDETATIVAAVLAALGKSPAKGQAASSSTRYQARTPRNELPQDAARNAVLWALNTEGLLGQAYEQAEANGDTLDDGTPYITQDVGTDILAEVFGPLPARTTA